MKRFMLPLLVLSGYLSSGSLPIADVGAASVPAAVALSPSCDPPAPLLGPGPPNDECANAIALSPGVNPTSGFFTNLNATNSIGFGDPCEFNNTGFADVFFTWHANCSSNVTISTCTPPGYPPGTNGDTHIDVYNVSACPTPPGSAIACDDDSGCGLPGLQNFLSIVTFPAVGGTTYLIRVANFNYGAPDPNYHPGTFYVTVSPNNAALATIGSGCSDGLFAGPSLSMNLPPVLGTSRTVTVSNAAPNSPGLMFFAPPTTFFTPMPGGCTLYLPQAQLTLFRYFATDASGVNSFTGVIPPQPFFECTKIWLQAIVLPATFSPFYQVTNGLELTLGY